MKYKIEELYRFISGSEKIIGKCETIESGVEIIKEYVKENHPTKANELVDLGAPRNKRSKVKHIMGFHNVRFLIMEVSVIE